MSVPRPWLVGSRYNVGTANPLIGVRAAFGSYPGSPLVIGIPRINYTALHFFYIPIIIIIHWW